MESYSHNRSHQSGMPSTTPPRHEFQTSCFPAFTGTRKPPRTRRGRKERTVGWNGYTNASLGIKHRERAGISRKLDDASNRSIAAFPPCLLRHKLLSSIENPHRRRHQASKIPSTSHIRSGTTCRGALHNAATRVCVDSAKMVGGE